MNPAGWETLARSTFPVGPTGISRTTRTRAGSLKRTSRSAQCLLNSANVTLEVTTTAASTRSPYSASGTPDVTASRTTSWASSNSPMSRGAIFAPPRLMSSLIRSTSDR